jgi:hypothetical protein
MGVITLLKKRPQRRRSVTQTARREHTARMLKELVNYNVDEEGYVFANQKVTQQG